MKREIKFRAWHNKVKEMLYAETPKYIFAWVDEGQPVEIMQFTGLHDKNGNEIYEGDIIIHDYLDGEITHSVIEWYRTGWYAKSLEDPTKQVAGYLELENCKNIEVIGNIYENPELLKITDMAKAEEKFKFGDIIVNHHASIDNPQRQGVFVNYDRNTIVLTDTKGNFWFPMLDKDAILEVTGNILESRPAVLMPGEEDLKQYITNLLYKARDNGADVLNETSFDSWQEEQESRFCQRKR